MTARGPRSCNTAADQRSAAVPPVAAQGVNIDYDRPRLRSSSATLSITPTGGIASSAWARSSRESRSVMTRIVSGVSRATP